MQEAIEQLRESEDVVQLYAEKVLKAADANVKEAQAGYAATKIPFLNLIEAQRNRVILKDRYFETLARCEKPSHPHEKQQMTTEQLELLKGLGYLDDNAPRP